MCQKGHLGWQHQQQQTTKFWHLSTPILGQEKKKWNVARKSERRLTKWWIETRNICGLFVIYVLFVGWKGKTDRKKKQTKRHLHWLIATSICIGVCRIKLASFVTHSIAGMETCQKWCWPETAVGQQQICNWRMENRVIHFVIGCSSVLTDVVRVFRFHVPSCQLICCLANTGIIHSIAWGIANCTTARTRNPICSVHVFFNLYFLTPIKVYSKGMLELLDVQ